MSPEQQGELRDQVKKFALNEKIRRAGLELADRDEPEPDLQITSARNIPRRRMKKAFGGRLIYGAFQLLVGPGAAGKGMLSADIAARLTTGEPFPGDDPKAWREPMTVMACVTEDSPERVIARLEAAGADLDRVHFATGPQGTRGGLIVPSAIAFDDDAGALLKRCQQLDVGALWLETTLEHLGDRKGKSRWSTNNEAEVRRALAPIVALCREADIIGWGVMHPRKSHEGGIEDTISGSAAFRNIGRSVLHVYPDPLDSDARLLVTSKANYMATTPSTLKFRIDPWEQDPEEGRAVWPTIEQGLIDDRSAEEIWRQIRDKGKAQGPRKDRAVAAAEQFLATLLADGDVHPDDVRKCAAEQNISWRAIERAKTNLGVESVREKAFKGQVIGWRIVI
jgi:putative DNA primase/helicase